MKDKDGGQLLPVTTTEQVKRGGAGKTLEDSMLEVEKLVPIMAAYGCNYNAETGFFEYAGLTDLTADDCRNMILRPSIHIARAGSTSFRYLRQVINVDIFLPLPVLNSMARMRSTMPVELS